MSSRFLPRVAIFARALLHRLAGGRRSAPAAPGRILIAHHLLLGDTLMLTPLLAKLRARHPRAEIAMAVPHASAPLYANRPYGVRALGWNPRDAGSVRRLLAEPGFDLALIPGDNRHSWLAQAMGARWIVAFAGDRPQYKSWLVDELRAYPEVPGAWFDITTTLVDGDAPAAYRASDWAPPAAAPFELPRAPYCVLHIGASARLKLWEPERWNALAAHLRAGGRRIAWSAGPGEEALVEACAPEPGDLRTSGRLDLAQLWVLLQNASLLVCPDTGVAHLGRVAGVPTIALFGPGSAVLAGTGDFWRESRYRALSITPFPCRDQNVLFKRKIPWVRVCKRTSAECAAPRCMQALATAAVATACDELLRQETSNV
ncbi:MAG: glycosyltransferase family 9 protein [Betaproteobacteria bacterium]|nr:glycosyltransferase family 9 protein [Betaproteobacteria bacterium]